MQSFAPRCWRWRRTLAERSWRGAAAGSAWRSQSQFWIQFLLHFRCFHWTVVNVVEDRGAGTISRKGDAGRGVWKSSQVNAVIVGAANMALPQSATAEAATATESALDNEKLKQEAEVEAERAGSSAGRGRGSWHESFRNVKMLCTLEVTVSGRARRNAIRSLACVHMRVCVRLSLPYAGNSQRNLRLHVLRTAFIGERTGKQEIERESETGRVREHNPMSINGKVVHTLKMQKQNCLRERRRVPLPLFTNVAPWWTTTTKVTEFAVKCNSFFNSFCVFADWQNLLPRCEAFFIFWCVFCCYFCCFSVFLSFLFCLLRPTAAAATAITTSQPTATIFTAVAASRCTVVQG